MLRRREVAGAVVLLCAATACASGRYINKNGGAPIYDVTMVNNCSRFTARLYIDEEYRNRRKIDVKPHPVGSKPRTMRLPAGVHSYYIEFHEFEEIKIRQGTFTIRRDGQVLEMC
jgi:hypothetical protein